MARVSILLVEDDECIRVITLAMLRALDYPDVKEAANGEEVVKACAASAFDLSLMDCEMPVLDGVAATRQIRALGVRTPILPF